MPRRVFVLFSSACRSALGVAGLLIALLALGGCGESTAVDETPTGIAVRQASPKSDRSRTPARGRSRGGKQRGGASSGAYEVVSDAALRATWGTIRGTCRLSHPAKRYEVLYGPELRSAEPCREVRYDDTTLGLADCLISLKITRGKDWPAAMKAKTRTAELVLRHARFEPRVSWVRQKTHLAVTYALGREAALVGGYKSRRPPAYGFTTQAGSGQRIAEAEAYLKKAGLYYLWDSLAPGLLAYLHVVPTPYTSAATGLDGAYELLAVPPGTYEIKLWHASIVMTPKRSKGELVDYDWGPPIEMTQSVTVGAGETVDVDWLIEVPDELRIK